MFMQQEIINSYHIGVCRKRLLMVHEIIMFLLEYLLLGNMNQYQKKI
jgi:hypothetical protein